MLIPVLPVYGRDLDVSYGLIGMLLAANAIGRVVGDLPSGSLIRRVGIKQTMLIGIGSSALCMALIFFVSDIWSASALLLAAGIGHAFYNISRHAYIAAVVPIETRGRAIGLLGGVFRMGKFLGPLLGGWIGGVFELRTVFPVYMVLLIGTGWFVWRYMESPKREPAPDQASHAKPLLVQTVQDNRQVLAWAGLGQILAQITRQGWTVIIPLYAAEVLGLGVEMIGIVVGVGAAFDMLFFYTSGVVMDRFGRKWAIVPSFVLQGIGVGLILFVSNVIGLALASAVIGLANATSSGTMMTLGSDLAPPSVRGEFLSVWRLIGDLGFVGGPIIVGGVAQALALQGSIIVIAGAGLTTALLFGLRVPETLNRTKIAYTSATNS
jgi:MFS family permease